MRGNNRATCGAASTFRGVCFAHGGVHGSVHSRSALRLQHVHQVVLRWQVGGAEMSSIVACSCSGCLLVICASCAVCLAVPLMIQLLSVFFVSACGGWCVVAWLVVLGVTFCLCLSLPLGRGVRAGLHTALALSRLYSSNSSCNML